MLLVQMIESKSSDFFFSNLCFFVLFLILRVFIEVRHSRIAWPYNDGRIPFHPRILTLMFSLEGPH